ncbi:bestrophin family protein [Echinicola shivajiensis]|uniref:bestrophin family protein n=1 Tax=Echinicola shivajiensis TaxID=1035916 RepID=UPI001BFC61DE|nr:bestrophin family ion channel [Echinicola shivajiensis]
MYIKRNYGFWMTFDWSKKPFIIGLIYSLAIFLLFSFLQIDISIPWQPISIIGIAVAFYLGFKNNSSYDRTWEARKIWGGIVNNSRSFGAAAVAFVQGEDHQKIKKELIYRHIAWLVALRYQLRLSREWEHQRHRLNDRYSPTVCEDYTDKLENELKRYLSGEDLDKVSKSTNTATQIMRLQSERLQELRDKEYFEDFRHMEFHALIRSFYDDQGKSERIKNFPFPRQYASTAVWLTFVFCAFVPLGLLNVFNDTQNWVYWAGPIISGLLIWVFFLMEKIGDYSENPFEGTYNDVPITSISRGIEIDLREMINDTNIPGPIKDENGFLM